MNLTRMMLENLPKRGLRRVSQTYWGLQQFGFVQIVAGITGWCIFITDAGRKWLEQNPEKGE